MTLERMIYLDAFLALAREPHVLNAYSLLKAWSEHAKGQNLSSAACHYLTHFVIPNLEGYVEQERVLPRWVDESLFHPVPESISSHEEWLGLFPGTGIEVIDDRFWYVDESGTSQEVPLGCEPPNEARRHFRGSLGVNIPSEMLSTLKTQNRGVYFTPNGYAEKRVEANVYRLNACFADFDKGSKETQMGVIRSLPLPPSAIVESGRGYHTYWLFKGAETDKVLWRRVQTSIIERCGSDAAIKDANRLMRLPFSWHCKDTPVEVRIVEYSTRRYTLAEIETAFPPKPVKIFTLSGGHPRELRIIQPTVLRKDERHPALVQETGRIYAKLPQEKAYAARQQLKIWYQASCKPLKTYWESEVDELCDWMEQKEYGAVVSR